MTTTTAPANANPPAPAAARDAPVPHQPARPAVGAAGDHRHFARAVAGLAAAQLGRGAHEGLYRPVRRRHPVPRPVAAEHLPGGCRAPGRAGRQCAAVIPPPLRCAGCPPIPRPPTKRRWQTPPTHWRSTAGATWPRSSCSKSPAGRPSKACPAPGRVTSSSTPRAARFRSDCRPSCWARTSWRARATAFTCSACSRRRTDQT